MPPFQISIHHNEKIKYLYAQINTENEKKILALLINRNINNDRWISIYYKL